MAELGRFHVHLQQHNFGRTRTRDNIFIALFNNGPCSTQSLLVTLEEKIGQATIYRNLKVFLKIGIIQ